MARYVDPATLSDAAAKAHLDDACRGASVASLAAGVATGPAKRRALRILKAHNANIAALSARLYGPAPTLDDLDDDALLAELMA